jgi:hypothetical protein
LDCGGVGIGVLFLVSFCVIMCGLVSMVYIAELLFSHTGKKDRSTYQADNINGVHSPNGALRKSNEDM